MVLLVGRDAKSGQHGQRACAIFSPSCANFFAGERVKLAELEHLAQIVASTISTAVLIFGLGTHNASTA